jgi:type IV pilus assembly protein PilE
MNHAYVFCSRPYVTIQSPPTLPVASVAGFSLIELMVAVAIVSILTTIAYPSYLSQMRKGRRSEAESALMDIAQRQQQYLLDARSYALDITTLNVTIPADVSAFYTITICQAAAGACAAPGGTPPAFAAIAAPKAGTPQSSDYKLTIDNTGAKSTFDSAGAQITPSVW